MDIKDARIIAKHLASKEKLTVPDFQRASGLAVSRVRFWVAKLQEDGSIVRDQKQIYANLKANKRGRPVLYYKWIGN